MKSMRRSAADIGRLAATLISRASRALAESLAGGARCRLRSASAIIAPPSTILVVDDSATNLQVLVRTLSGSGHRILAARDGPTALEIARKAQPDLMLLDVMMPGMDGFEVCRRIKSEPDTRDTVVIFLSARGEVADKVSGLELGAIDYITKPIQAEEVLARVAVHLSRLHLERELRQSRDRLDHELASAARCSGCCCRWPCRRIRRCDSGPTTRPAAMPAATTTMCCRSAPDRFGILVADVSGHGAPAAIVMAMIRAVVHAYPGVADDPPALLHYINRHFQFLVGHADVCDGVLRRA